MQTIDKTQLPGKYKAWMYQHGLLPRHLRRRLGVPPSFTYIGLYGKTTKLQLPLYSVLEEFKVSMTRLVVTLRDSSDQLISQAGI